MIVAKYDALADWLTRQLGLRIVASFADLDALVSGLPPSARTDRTRWGNTTNRTRVQAQAWMGAGWRAEIRSSHGAGDVRAH